jgi:hypothetical protein
MQLYQVEGQIEQGHPRDGATLYCYLTSVLLFANLLASALTSQRGFYTLLFSWFQVKGVALDFLNDVFLLYLAFEAA